MLHYSKMKATIHRVCGFFFKKKKKACTDNKHHRVSGRDRVPLLKSANQGEHNGFGEL